MKNWHKEILVYSPGFQAISWGFDYSQIVDLSTALAQPTRIAVLPVYYDTPGRSSYSPELFNLQIDQFDLVLFTDIECHTQAELINWINTTAANTWLLSMGSINPNEILDSRAVYRPYWSFNFLQWNPPREDFPLDRQFLFDCLCGARREHRDYAMMSLDKHNLLEKSLATYRNIFQGDDIHRRITVEFPDQTIKWPYVSPNLNPQWEVQEELNNSISSIVPWEIYNRCWYTILMETLGTGECYFMTEKTGKCLHARRLFVHFGVPGLLEKLRRFGFETFSSVLDESYDQRQVDIFRWRDAFEQVKYLSQQNHRALLEKVRPILDHNHHRLYQFRQEKYDEMRCIIEPYLK